MGRLFDALYRAGDDGLSRDDAMAIAGIRFTSNLHGTIAYLRNEHGVAVEVRGWRPGNAHQPGRYYLAPFGSGTA